MDLTEIIRICKAYNGLGWAVQAQLDDLIAGDTEQNQNAIKLIEKFARSLPTDANEELTALVAEFHAAKNDAD